MRARRIRRSSTRCSTPTVSSFRVTKQIFEGLVDLKPGSTAVGPRLATSWDVDKSGKVWTFKLRHGVKFHDGTAFNAKAVCFNFNRWYNFTGAFQNAARPTTTRRSSAASRTTRSRRSSSPSLYKSCKAKGQYTAVIKLTRPSGRSSRRCRSPSFAIQSPTALKKYGAEPGDDQQRSLRSDGHVRVPAPDGHRPVQVRVWTVEQKVVLNRNAKYWGKKAKLKQIIVGRSPTTRRALQALQTGEVNAIGPGPAAGHRDDQQQLEPEDVEPAGVQRRLRRDQPGEAADGQAAGPAGGRLRARTARRS